jgi:6-pyruvoyltetrahydropterin/6-carboxytetrahydropterin synthase
MNFQSTKLIELGSCAFRQWSASSHCRFVHGYQLKAKFWFGASHLDEKNWVVDFAGLKELKAILQQQFDHTLCIASDDPLLPLFLQLHEQKGCDLRVMEGVGIEKTAEWCFNVANDYVKKMTNNRCWVESVEVFEHEANSAKVDKH